jgi:hypothetical protein
MERWRVRVGGLVVALWFCSALAQVYEQARSLLPPPADPGVPFDDPAAVLALLQGCQGLLGPGDKLVVLHGDDSVVHTFERYRLAYLLYPAVVEARVYPAEAQDGLSTAVVEALERHPTHVLVLGSSPGALPGMRSVADFGQGARLFRVAPTGER